MNSMFASTESISKLNTPTKSPYNSLKASPNQAVEYKMRTEKIKNYQAKLTEFERKLKARKRKFNFSLKESIANLTEQQSNVEKQMDSLEEQYRQVKQQKDISDQNLQNHKLHLIDLENEKNRIDKTNKWAESTFSLLNSQNSYAVIRDSVFNTMTDLSQIKTKMRSSRNKIFYYQKQILKLEDEFAPIRVQVHLLQSKIDYEKENKVENDELPIKTQLSLQSAVKAQHLSIEKMKSQKHINEMNQRLYDIKMEKHDLMKKLAPLQASEKDKILQTIIEQINQYEEASQRRKNFMDNRTMSVNDAISKELEIKIEIDNINSEKNEINQQKIDTQKILAEKKSELNNLQQILMTSNYEDSNKDPLNELIAQIRNLREEERRIAQIKPKSFIIDGEELEAVRLECEQEYNDLQLQVEKEKDFNRQMNEEIIRLTENMPKKEPLKYVIPDTPKMIILKKRIGVHEENIQSLKRTVDKKLSKIAKKQEKYDNYIKQLDLKSSRPILKMNIADQLERSMNWFLQMIRSQVKQWISYGGNTPQILNTWDTNIISAVLNEAEELELKNSIL
ncbi:hypothetical protein TRFO_40728 [Tritrichomonas foetus]|uniref:Uncharacterized protein n=1 Tax=Tritrichomonas foetus TaxID=1144522 RepID=A0A1J4J469_9EUKA|nr:hypothetical protein TRFO_40728 [Tritrichomonas foetus]|eukprot:OHS92935.1 hypothetical protein TRFO_40728 [Tritrichomonas foetus]